MRNYEKSGPEAALSTLILHGTCHRKIKQRTNLEESQEKENKKLYFQSTHLFRILEPSVLSPLSLSLKTSWPQAQLRGAELTFCPFLPSLDAS